MKPWISSQKELAMLPHKSSSKLSSLIEKNQMGEFAKRWKTSRFLPISEIEH